MPEEVTELEATDELLATLDSKMPSTPKRMEFAGMAIIDAMMIYFGRAEQARSEDAIIEALVAGGIGIGAKRAAALNIRDSIRHWTSKGKLLKRGDLVWPSDWGPEPPLPASK